VVFQRDGSGGVKPSEVVEDTRPGSEDYDPGHPDADPNGFVKRSNVDINTEIVDLMIARRVHEANATVFQSAKAMLRRAIDI
jgi:flagellar basal-body rod protein FlgC